MKTIDLETTAHEFKLEKKVFDADGNKKYSIYVCTHCSMRGKRLPNSLTLEVSNEYDHYKITHCLTNLCKDVFVGKQIQITKVWNKDPEYKNLKFDTVHTIVIPPLPHVNGNCGVWVQGINKRVKVLFEEFKMYSSFKRTK